MAQYNNSQNNINYNTPVLLSGAANVTASLSDYIIGIDNTDAARTVTLPTATSAGSAANTGKVYIIKDQSGGAGTNNITIQPATGTIDGAASILISADYGEVQVYSDGAAWYSSAGPELNSPLPVPQGGTGVATITDGGIVLGSGTDPVTVTSQPTDGQLLVGSTGGDPVLANLTQGAGISITNAAGSITLASTAVVWSAQALGTALLANEGFLSTAATAQNFPLPTSAQVGEIFELAQSGAGSVTITQGDGQSIRFGNSTTTAGTGGSLVSSSQGDAIKLVCTQENTSFQSVTGSIGNWTVI